MFDWLHSFGRLVVLWFEGDRVLAVLCVVVVLLGVGLWFSMKRWKARSLGDGNEVVPVGGQLVGLEMLQQSFCPLVLEWEVLTTEKGAGDIGDLERRLLQLQDLRLDLAYDVVVSLYSRGGTLNRRIPEILGRRFPEYGFYWDGGSVERKACGTGV
ncbi:MAG: hypothetical protein FWG40_00165 [Peptococcaceae bacterium]|nr:hypothetical protein [Peptococcaceae bacterium]